MFDIKKYKVKLELLEPMLGTNPTADIWKQHVATQMEKGMRKDGKSADEIKTEIDNMELNVPIEDLGLSHFLKDDHGYYVNHHQVRGYLKAVATAMKEWGKVKQLKNKISMWVFVKPNKIYVARPDVKLEIVERPLRAETPQGPRTSIARSESLPAGTILNFEIHTLNEMMDETFLRALLEYGEYQGLGQNRGAGFGQFTILEFEEA